MPVASCVVMRSWSAFRSRAVPVRSHKLACYSTIHDPHADRKDQHRMARFDVEAVFAGLADALGERASRAAAVRAAHGASESYHAGHPPDIVVFPQSTDEVVAIVNICAAHGAPIVPWGAGTSLEGNAAAVRGGV